MGLFNINSMSATKKHSQVLSQPSEATPLRSYSEGFVSIGEILRKKYGRNTKKTHKES